MTPTSHCYFDYYQGDAGRASRWPSAATCRCARSTPSSPCPPELTPDEAEPHPRASRPTSGPSTCRRPTHAEYMAYPRGSPRSPRSAGPPKKRDWTDFTRPHGQAVRALRAGGPSLRPERLRRAVHARARPGQKYTWHQARNRHLSAGDPVHASTETTRSPTSPVYRRPILPKKTGVIKAAAFLDGRPADKPPRLR